MTVRNGHKRPETDWSESRLLPHDGASMCHSVRDGRIRYESGRIKYGVGRRWKDDIWSCTNWTGMEHLYAHAHVAGPDKLRLKVNRVLP